MAACLMFKAEVARHGSFAEAGVMDVGKDLEMKRRVYSGKIAAIQKLADFEQPAVVPKKITFRIRVSRIRARCRRHFLSGFEKLELTEDQISQRRHALAQKLIAKTLQQSDRRPRRRLIRLRRRKTSICLSPFISCTRWLRQPFVRLARIASLAVSKVELRQAAFRDRNKYSSRVTCYPLELDENLPLLPECEAC